MVNCGIGFIKLGAKLGFSTVYGHKLTAVFKLIDYSSNSKITLIR